MARVTVAEVRAILPSTTLTDEQIQAAIDSATLVVDRLAASPCGQDLTDDELKQIELWYSAHLCAQIDPSIAKTEEKFENYSVKFSRGSGNNMAGIMSTSYGQMANTLSGGCLAKIDLKPSRMAAIGKGVYDE